MHADDVGLRDGLLDLGPGGGGDADTGDLALVAQRDHFGQLIFEGDPVGGRGAAWTISRNVEPYAE